MRRQCVWLVWLCFGQSQGAFLSGDNHHALTRADKGLVVVMRGRQSAVLSLLRFRRDLPSSKFTVGCVRFKRRSSDTCDSLPNPARAWITLLVVLHVLFGSSPAAYSHDDSMRRQWNFGTDRVVELNVPLSLSNLRLTHPTLLGAGGGGAVFSMLQQRQTADPSTAPLPVVAVKISWLASADSVTKECSILSHLEERKVHGVERCLAMDRYPNDPRRVMIALQPVLVDDASSLSDIQDLEAQARATRQLMQTLVEMLAARVVATDVQVLTTQAGELLLVDLTEAKALPMTALNPMDASLASSFCSEMLSQVPQSLHLIADNALADVLSTTRIDDDLTSVLASQREILLI